MRVGSPSGLPNFPEDFRGVLSPNNVCTQREDSCLKVMERALSRTHPCWHPGMKLLSMTLLEGNACGLIYLVCAFCYDVNWNHLLRLINWSYYAQILIISITLWSQPTYMVNKKRHEVEVLSFEYSKEVLSLRPMVTLKIFLFGDFNSQQGLISYRQ